MKNTLSLGLNGLTRLVCLSAVLIFALLALPRFASAAASTQQLHTGDPKNGQTSLHHACAQTAITVLRM